MNQSALTMAIRHILFSSLTLCSYATYAADQPEQLPTIEIKAQHDQAPAYTATSSRAATKLDLSLKDTPQSVTVMTSQRIEEQNLKTVEEVLSQTPGIYIQRFGAQGAVGNGGEYTFYYARGNQILNYQVDGVMTSPATSGKNGSSLSNLDPIIYENITVLKGAAGLTNGAGYPSASVGLNRKHANQTDPTGSIKINAGSNNTIRSEFDVQSALNASGTVRGRLVAAYGQNDSWRDWGDQRNATLYGVLDTDLGAKTQLSLGALLSRARLDGQGVHGITIFGDDGKIMPFDREFNPNARWAYSNIDTLNLFTEFKHEFANRWKVQANYNYTKQDIESLYGVIGVAQVDYSNMTASLAASQNDFSPEEHSMDISATGYYQLLGREHELMFGASYQRLKSDNNAYAGYNARGVIDLNTWDGNIAMPTEATVATGLSHKDYEQSGYYLATRLNPIEALHIILGGRLSNYDLKTRSTNDVRNTVSDTHIKESNELTPYAGITFDITPYLTAYASYTNIFLPQSNRDYSYNVLDPQQGDNYEGGLKASFYDDRLNLSAAYFQAKMDNVAETAGKYTDTDEAVINGWTTTGSNYYRAVKGAETKGFEVEVAGQILPEWNIQAGYTQAETKDNNGQRINTDRPKQQFKMFSTYNLPILDRKLTVGAGLNWQSEFYDNSKTGLNYQAFRQKSFTLVDLMARYTINKDLNVSFNVSNLTDEKYRLNTWANTYGDPRRYTASIHYNF
ncbi:TonB-dependent siderophore receptor [Acinetobacter larvae]|uniref:TonB-dependent receptor n=1 Tax=Acinetobacter larvae TaxID=1789224 RepID=A0A1B2LVI5_9GAMM|nr:TonB-dependent siderophore receptor [Acinetobacter larvae]AOA56929.1 TonB-dependent receptor [Acinetobacter larvae]